MPKTIARRETYSFQFTIHNLEYENITYPYNVYLEVEDKKVFLDQGHMQIGHNEYKTIKVEFGPLKTNIKRAKIVVELVNKNQVVSFWMEGTK